MTLAHAIRTVSNGAVVFGLLVACGEESEGVGIHAESPNPPASDGGSARPASESGASQSETSAAGPDASDADSEGDAPAVEDDRDAMGETPSSLDAGAAGSKDPHQDAATHSTDADPALDSSDGMTSLQSDASVGDATAAGSDPPAAGSLPRGLGTDELAAALQRYWLVDAQIGGCGDLFRYERFAVQPSFSRFVHSTPGCSGAYPDGSTEYPGTYQLSGRRLSVLQTDIAFEEHYDIAIEETVLGLVQHPGIYLPQTETAWTQHAARELRNAEGAQQWRIASSVTVDFGAALPLAEGESCSVSLNVQLEFEQLEPEGDFLLEFGPYTCNVEHTGLDLILALPLPTAEELSMLDTLTSDTVSEVWPTRLRLPRPNAEYLLPMVAYPEIAESDVKR